ncbi:MAG TPA: energy transducer TonB, partial [Anaeromyxobacter sp.]
GLEPAPEGERPSGGPGPGGPPAPGPGARAPDLRPSAGSLARIAGGPSTDGVGEVGEGDETALSSREFRFATFLNQMRNAIGEIWYPSVEAAIRARDPEGRDVFFRERTVVLELTLGPSGELRRLAVAESSDVAFVDAVAIAAVRKAQPFSNPPRAMFGPRGEARIPFAFTVFPFERGGLLRWRAPAAR